MSLAAKLKPIFFTAIILLVFLGVMECLCHVFQIPYHSKIDLPEKYYSQYDHELGWSYIPGMIKYEKYHGVPMDIPVYFDKNGIRVPDPEHILNPNKPSVLFVGGSYTMGHAVKYENSLPGKFDALKQMPYQAVNLGVQAYGTDQSLLALKRHLPRFNTKAVVYGFMNAHFWRNGNYDRRMLYPSLRVKGTKPLFKLDRKNRLYLAKKPVRLNRYFHLRLLDLIIMRGGRALGIFPPMPDNVTRALILEMKKYAEQNNAEFIIINWNLATNGIHEIVDKGKYNIIDVSKNAPLNWKHKWSLPWAPHHPNASANEHVARLLFEHLKEKNLL